MFVLKDFEVKKAEKSYAKIKKSRFLLRNVSQGIKINQERKEIELHLQALLSGGGPFTTSPVLVHVRFVTRLDLVCLLVG